MALLDHKNRAKLFYRYFSRVYDYINPIFYSSSMREKVVEMAEIESGDLVLEVGCGTGFTTLGIAKKVGEERIFGVDLSLEQINKAKRKLGANFILGDAENLPFKDKTFDSAISAGSIEYWPNPLKGISEMVRVTKSGGKVVILAPRKPDNALIRKFAESIMLFPSSEQCVEWFRKAGLKEIDFVETGPYSFWSKLVVIVAGRVP